MGAGVIGAEIEVTYSHDFIAETVTTPQVHHANLGGGVMCFSPTRSACAERAPEDEGAAILRTDGAGG